MDDLVKWALELVNKVSGPGKDVVRALQRIRQAGRDVDASMNRAAEAIGMRGMGRAALTALTGLPKVIGKGARSMLEAAAAGVSSLAAGGVALAGALVAGLAVAGAAMVGDAFMFREQSIEGFRVLTGSASHAKALYEHVLNAAQVFGQSPKEMLGTTKKLLQAGFDTAQALSLVQTAADLKALNRGLNVDQLVEGLGKLKGKVQITEDTLGELLKTSGLSRQAFVKVVGSMRGVDTAKAAGLAQVNALLASGALSGDEAAIAIQRTTLAVLGTSKAGEYAQKASTSVGGLLEKLKNAPEQFLLRMTVEDGPLKGFLTTLTNALDPTTDTGKRVTKALTTVGDALGKTLERFNDPAKIDAFVNGLVKLIETLPTVIGFFITLGRWGYTIVLAFATLKDNIKFLWNELTQLGAVGTVIKTVLYGLVSPIVALMWVVYNAGKVIVDFVVTVGKWFADLITSALDWGANIVGGIWEGIKKAWKGLLDNFKILVAQLPAGVKKILGIASPSKVMMNLGVNTVLGFQKGVSDNASLPQVALQNAISAPDLPNLGSAFRGGLNAPISIGDINVSLTGTDDEASARRLGRAAGRAIREEILLALELARTEQGGPPDA